MVQNYYATPEMVKDFLNGLSGTDELPEFPDALIMMQEKGLLSKDPLPRPELNGTMQKDAFVKAFDQQPFEVNWVIRDLRKEHEENRQIALSNSVDIACAQHIHNYGFTKQTLKNVFAFTYILQGICTIAFENTEIQLEPGNVFIASPGFEHFIHTTPETFALVIVVRAAAFEILFHDFLSSDLSLSEFFRKYLVKKETGNYCTIRGDKDDDELRFLIQALACETISKTVSYANSCAISYLKLFLASAFRKYHSKTDFYRQNFTTAHLDANTIYQFIQMNYQTVTLSMLAEKFHFNRSYVSRYIHAHFHKTFQQIVIELKISHAKEYLRKTTKSISEISSLVGFESLNHFSKTFRKITGQTASDYRKKHFDP